jgi:flagellar protein FlbD
MISLTRLNGPPFALNCDLIERVESTPDTVVTLVDGTKYVVAEPVATVVERVRDYRASIVALVQQSEVVPPAPSLRVVPTLDPED